MNILSFSTVTGNCDVADMCNLFDIYFTFIPSLLQGGVKFYVITIFPFQIKQCHTFYIYISHNVKSSPLFKDVFLLVPQLDVKGCAEFDTRRLFTTSVLWKLETSRALTQRIKFAVK